jgi:elongation factor P--beta-lysine ligase
MMDFCDFLLEEDLISVEDFFKMKNVAPELRWEPLCELLMENSINPKIQQNRYKAIVLKWDPKRTGQAYVKPRGLGVDELYDPNKEEKK